MSKETIANMVEKGFYAGAAATVGIVVVCAAPEIAIACTIGVVAYKATERMANQITDLKGAWAMYKSKKSAE